MAKNQAHKQSNKIVYVRVVAIHEKLEVYTVYAGHQTACG